MPALIKGLADSNAQCRFWSASALGNIGPEAKQAVAALTKMLRDTPARNRARAAQALGKIGPDARTAVPDLKRLKQDKDPSVRHEVDLALKTLLGK